jgi:hypothetical protein
MGDNLGALVMAGRKDSGELRFNLYGKKDMSKRRRCCKWLDTCFGGHNRSEEKMVRYMLHPTDSEAQACLDGQKVKFMMAHKRLRRGDHCCDPDIDKMAEWDVGRHVIRHLSLADSESGKLTISLSCKRSPTFVIQVHNTC